MKTLGEINNNAPQKSPYHQSPILAPARHIYPRSFQVVSANTFVVAPELLHHPIPVLSPPLAEVVPGIQLAFLDLSRDPLLGDICRDLLEICDYPFLYL